MSHRQRQLAHLSSEMEWLDASRAAIAYESAQQFDRSDAYGLNLQVVANIERCTIGGALDATTIWLRRRIAEPIGVVLVIYGKTDVARVHVGAFLTHWCDMFSPGRDDVLILPEVGEWALFYCHDDWFEYGRAHRSASA